MADASLRQAAASALHRGGMAFFEIRELRRSFHGVAALRGVSLDVEAGRITGLIGPNGAGKTTLFNCVSGLLRPQGGRVRLEGEDVTGWRPDRLTRRGLVRSFQIARGFPRLSVIENLLLYGLDQPGERVAAAVLFGTRARRREAELREQALAVARRLNLAAVLDEPAAALSGGQKKLLELGRALMASPRLLLLDEPVAGVNPSLGREIEDHLRELTRDGMTILLIEHRMSTIAGLCDRVVVLSEGSNLAEGDFAELIDNPLVQAAYMGQHRPAPLWRQ
jgi:branched-chain amino acid transport system ATP-binding protein/neutral amino acid transport system ATP-binding protein